MTAHTSASQVYLILDEFICGGEIQETAKKVGQESKRKAGGQVHCVCGRGTPPERAHLASNYGNIIMDW